MKRKLYTLFLTALLGMFGMQSWAQTSYEIGTAEDLVAFAEKVNSGQTDIAGVLTADIDLSSVMSTWKPIGDWSSGAVTSAYCGHFDGQGHKITGFNGTSSQNYFGIFGVISTGALIENFSVYGTITTNIATAGVVGYARDATPTIRNIHSYLNINNTRAGSRLGGILGSSVNGEIIVDRCTYSGTMDGNDAGNNGNYGGIVGYENNNASAHLRVNNCLFDGKLINSAATPGNCTFGGIVGYVGASPDVIITNCLSIGTLQSAVTGQFYGAVKHDTCFIINSFYKGDNVNGSASTVTPTTQEATKVTDEELQSGEIAYKLNGSESGAGNWFQKFGEMPLAFVAEQYVITVNGEPRDPETQNVTLERNTDGTYKFVLTGFVLHTNTMYDIPVGDISLDGVHIQEDGTFYEEGLFSVPDENIPTFMATYSDNLQNIPYKLKGKVNGESLKLYADIWGLDIKLGGIFPDYAISIQIGTDDFEASGISAAYPTPNGTALVYANRQHCDGTPYDDTTYANENTGITVDDHEYVDGFCDYCGTFDETWMAANADGVFEIGTPAQLKWFAAYVNEVNPAANAVLTANIDMTDVEWTPIGKEDYYTGTFNGQGFAITNLYYEGSGDNNGLFGKVKNATIGNFSISGTIYCAGTGTGVIGWSEGSTISDIQSSVTIIAADGAGVLHHAGGVVGSCRDNSIVERCTYSGEMYVNAESHDCFGGIAGYTNTAVFNDCLFTGSITYKKSNGYVGGIVGYINNTACKGTHNCLSIGQVIYAGEGTPDYGGAIIGRLNSHTASLFGDSYWLAGSASQGSGGNQLDTNYEVTAEQLASGEVAYKLGAPWGQEIGVDPYPVLGGPAVFAWGNIYNNVDPSNFNIETAQGDADCILPSKKWGGAYDAYTWVANADFDYGDWNESNPNYNVIIGTPAENNGKAWYAPGYSVEGWNYGQDLPNFGDGRPADVYAVRYFTVDGEIPTDLYMPAAHDDAPCEYYINGELIWAETDGWKEDEVVRLSDAQKALIKTDGSVNVFAFHVHQNWGGRYADGGLYTAGNMVNDFWSSYGNLDAVFAKAEADGIDAEWIDAAKAKVHYRAGMDIARNAIIAGYRLKNVDTQENIFKGSAPADGGQYYIYNVGAKRYLTGGVDYGTHAAVNFAAQLATFKANEGGFRIHTNIRNGSDALNFNAFVDCGGDGDTWFLNEVSEGVYNISRTETGEGKVLLGYNGPARNNWWQVDSDCEDASDPNNQWILVTKEERDALLAEATAENPVDATYYIHAAGFDHWLVPSTLAWPQTHWTWNNGGDGGWEPDFVYEVWHAGETDMSQTLEGLPAGKYIATVQGYYRDGDNAGSYNYQGDRQEAYFYAGDAQVLLPNIGEEADQYPLRGNNAGGHGIVPDSREDAAGYFGAGLYKVSVEVTVGADGTLKIGAHKSANVPNDWMVLDNFRLTYLGNSVEAVITEAGYATFVAPGNINSIPADVEAFAAQKVEGKDFIHLEPVTAIPAGEAVVLRGAAGTYSMYVTASAVELGTTNDLIAATEPVTCDGTQYVLFKDADEEAGFYKGITGTVIPAGKAYVVITGAGVKDFYPFGDDDATGIANVNVNDSFEGAIYNVAGQRLQKMQKGINIVGNKKILK